MNIEEINMLHEMACYEALEKCCGSTNWIIGMINDRPYKDEDDLFGKADCNWDQCDEDDALEAFTHHPRIGEESLREKFASTAEWAGNEQKGVETAEEEVIVKLAKANKSYFRKFGYIFIVYATGKSAKEMLDILKDRIGNKKAEEILIAKAEQHKITRLRLKKLLS